MRYDRQAAVTYAHRWAYGRNPAYLDFEALGGDCTNFASQVLLAGGLPMDYLPVYGWFYRDGWRRTASWTGVEYLYRYLLALDRLGTSQARVVPLADVEPGDIVQLSFSPGRYHHSPVVVAVQAPDPQGILVAAHSIDADNRSLSTYAYDALRPLHIVGQITDGGVL